jgi:hypothetical protein
MDMSFKPICREDIGDGRNICKSLEVLNLLRAMGASGGNIPHFKDLALIAVSPDVAAGSAGAEI